MLDRLVQPSGVRPIGRQDNVPHRFAALFASALLLAALLPANALAATLSPPRTSASSATLITMSGMPLWSRSSTAKRRVASTIKMLNALVVRDRTRLTEVVTVPRAAAAIDNGDVGLVTGQRLTVHQLLSLMLVASANDAAEALAIHIAGSEKSYVALMNAKAKSLGLKNTTAADAHGLGKREHSTADDLSVLARRVMADPVLRAIVAKRTVAIPQLRGEPVVVASTDRLLGTYRGMEGVKTGFTDPAGYCFVGAAKRGDVELLGVVLGASSVDARFSEMRKLLDWGFAHAHRRRVVSQEETIGVMPVGVDVRHRVIVHPVRSVSVTLLDGGPPLAERLSFGTVRLPLRAGHRVGTLDVFQGKALLASVPLIVLVDVPAPAPVAAALAPAPKSTDRAFWDDILAPVLGFWQRLASGAA